MKQPTHLPVSLGVAALLLAAGVGPARPQQVEVMRKEAVKGKAETTTVKGLRKDAAKSAPGGKAAVTRVVIAPAAPVQVFVPDKAQQDALEEQFARQIRPVLRAELHLIRAACAPSEEDRAALTRAGEKALQDAARQIAEAQMKMRQGIGQAMPDAPALVQKALADAVSERLTPGQAGRYRAETEARADWDRETAARNLVARFDGLLNLSAEQRDRIAAALGKSNDPMVRSLDTVLYNQEYLPAVPEDAVLPFLDDRQKELWRDVQKVRFGTSHIGIAGVNLSEDDLAEEDGPDAVRTARRRKLQNQFRAFINAVGRLAPPPPGAGNVVVSPAAVVAPAPPPVPRPAPAK